MRAAPRVWPIGAAVLAALAVAVAVDRRAPWPTADVSRGGEDAFASGLYPRELPPGGRPLRWTTAHARLRFRHLPEGPARLSVRVRGHRGPVRVAVDGVEIGILPPGGGGDWPIAAGRSVAVDLVTEPFVAAGGRRLGAQLEAVTLEHARGGLPALGLLLAFVAPAAVMAAAAVWAGLPALAALALSLAVTCFQAALLWPRGLVRSEYALVLAVSLALGAAAAAVFARASERWREGSGRWAFLAVTAAVLVQGVLVTSPVMVVSDAVFHANNLGRVAGGDWLLTSVTQHARPVRFPYGVSFYGLLVPLAHAGLDGVTLVRSGAALSAVAASAALFRLVLPAGAPLAALAVVIWQLLPGTVDVFSYGNLTNVFGQAVTVLFVAWWLDGRRWWVGAALVAVAALAHLSCAIVLGVLGLLLILFDRDAAGRRHRMVAVAVGLGLAGVYYLSFLPMMWGQLPVIGGAAGQNGGPWSAAVRQAWSAVGQWGWPALVLGILGVGWMPPGRLGAALRAWWACALALAALAVVSPVEVRYWYATAPALAVAAAVAVGRLWTAGLPARLAAAVALLFQATLAGVNGAAALLARYRP
jgi:hypothetical protein